MARPSQEYGLGAKPEDVPECTAATASRTLLKDHEEHGVTPSQEPLHQREVLDEKDIDASGEKPVQLDLVAKEDYSVYTVPQKRAIVLAGSFISWFSPMTGSIYYPAIDQVRLPIEILLYSPNFRSDCRRS